MSGFLANIINRHTQAENTVGPRLRGLFEPRQSFSEGLSFTRMEPAIPQETSNVKNNNYDAPEKATRRDFPEKIFKGKLNKPIIPIIPALYKNDPLNFSTLKQGEGERKEGRSTQATNAGRQLEGMLATEHLRKAANALPQILKPIIPEQQSPKSAAQNFSEPYNVVHPDLHHLDFLSVRNRHIVNPGQPSPPTIKIHIGRIEIKAVKQEKDNVRKVQKPLQPKMSLEQYLEKREGK